MPARRGVTDEFIEPIVVEGTPRIEPGDAVIFFNFRPDRGRQADTAAARRGSRRHDDDALQRASSTAPSRFPSRPSPRRSPRCLPRNGVRQLHVAETEKYAHVTYFFNGGRRGDWTGRTRLLVPSPREVASYDLKPEMSADEVAERFCAEDRLTATASASSTSPTRTWSATPA